MGYDKKQKRMNRKYTTARYKEATEILRKYYPSANFTTDVIVGFPGETDEEFNQTYQFLKEIGLAKIYQNDFNGWLSLYARMWRNSIQHSRLSPTDKTSLISYLKVKLKQKKILNFNDKVILYPFFKQVPNMPSKSKMMIQILQDLFFFKISCNLFLYLYTNQL